MKNRLYSIVVGVFLGVFIVFAFGSYVFAGEDINSLKQQIEALKQKVESLENEKKIQSQSNGLLGMGRQTVWDPFDEMQRMQEEMNRMFQDSYMNSGNTGMGMFSNDMSYNTNLDIREGKDGYEITFDMKGLDQDKVDIKIDDRSITIKGERSKNQMQEGENSYFSSQSFGTFMKTIPLPFDADASRVETEKKGDELIIRISKKAS